MPTPRGTKPERVQTSLRLPKPVYEQARLLIGRPLSGIESFNDLVIVALRSFIKHARRRQIDLAFRGMSEDAAFQNEAQSLAREFEESDWEALKAGDKLPRRAAR